MAIELISKIKPKNNGNFKLVDAQDVEYNGKGLDEAIASGEFKGDKGDRGDIGPIGPAGPTGPKGDNGNDGFNPTVSVAEEADGVTVTVQNKDGAQTAKVKNGKDYEHSEEFSALASQVRADKESVEQSKTSVEQTVAQAEGKIDTAGAIAVQDVQNEGTTQTEKVTVEGTKQITEIQSKGEEILHSFPQDFPTQMDTKLDKQQGVENVGKALVIGGDGNVVPGEVQSGDDLLIVNTASGESPLAISDSSGRKIKGFRLTGKTEQVQTTGKNLFDSNIAKNKENYKEVTIAGSVIYAIELSLKPNTKYAFQCVIKSVTTTMNVGNSTIRYVVSDGQKRVIMTNEDGKLYIGFSGNPDNEIHKIDVSIVDIQVEESTTVTSYEPYTGGKPSPSPEYQQEIKNSGKWIEEKQKYEVDVKIIGKNLLNLQKEPDVKGTYQGWKVGNGELLTLGVKDKGNNADIKRCYIGFSDQGSESKGAVWVVDNGVIKVNPLNQRKTYVSIFPANETTVKKLTDRFDIQCELGNVATPYQPYKEQTLTLTSDRPITKWDRLVEQGGQIGWLYKHKIIEDFSTLVKDTEPIYGNDGGKYFSVSLQNASLNYDRRKIYSEVGICGKDDKKYYIPKPLVASTIIYVSDTDTIMIAKEHMHYKVVYETVDSEFIPLPQSEQNAIRALTTYYPTTVITADGGELDPDIEVTYTADTKNYIDNKFAQLQKSLINTQVQLL